MKKRLARKKKVHFIPAGYHSVTPYLACGDGAAAIEFYKKAFGATEVVRMPGPDGKKDVDAAMQRAVAAGARLTREAKDQFYGDRLGTVEDPFGHVWHLATHKEDLSKAQMRKRAEKAMQEMGGG